MVSPPLTRPERPAGEIPKLPPMEPVSGSSSIPTIIRSFVKRDFAEGVTFPCGDDIHGALKTTPDDKCSIYIVPPQIRGLDEDAYRPKVVSIGPYHHQMPKEAATADGQMKAALPYADTQRCKWLVLRNFISRHNHLSEPGRTARLMDQCTLKMIKHEAKIRSYYSHPIWTNSKELRKLMILDGCFILHLLLEHPPPRVAGMVWIWTIVRYDLLLLENQIPFFVLYKLLKILGIGEEKKVDLVERARHMFQDAHPLGEKREKILPLSTTGRKNEQLFHLLHIFYTSVLPPSSSSSKDPESQSSLSSSSRIWIPCASELTDYGIKFKRKSITESFLDVSFTKGVMEIPPILIDDYSKNLFRNLIAFEQCYPHTECHVTVYSSFMECIINTDKDARLLSLNNVLTNRMCADQHLSLFFSNLCKGIHIAQDRFYLENVFMEVAKYQNNKFKQYWVECKRTYCSNTWAVFATAVSIIFFIIGIVQTIYTVMSFYQT